MVRRFGGTIAFLTLLSASAAAQPQLRISQVQADENGITAYLDTRDGDKFMPSVAAASLSATLAGQKLPLESVRAFGGRDDGVLYLLLVDISRSIRPTAFDLFKHAATALVDTLGPADRMAIYTIGESVALEQQVTSDKQALKRLIGRLEPNRDRTKLYAALDLAIQYARSQGAGWPKRRAILVLSDGQDDGSGLVVEDLRRRLEEGRVPIFATGYRTERPSVTARAALASLQNLAVTSGGLFAEATPGDVGRVHETVQAAIRQVQVARFQCRDCGEAPLLRRLSVSYVASGVTVSDNIPVVFVACTDCPKRQWKMWAFAGAGVLVVGAVATVFIVTAGRRRRANVQVPAAPQPMDSIATLPWRKRQPIPQTEPRSIEPTRVKTAPVDGGQSLIFTTVHGGKNGQRFSVTVTPGRPIVGGRGSQCDIVLQHDPAVADRQFEVRYEGAGFVILLDLAGGGKTQKNGVPITPRAKLEDGDIIGAGSTELRVRFGAS